LDLKYTPLTLYNPSKDPDSTKFELRHHFVGVPEDTGELVEERPIDKMSLIQFGKDFKAKLCVCITQYNEPLTQLIESLAGIYRAYYELGK
jgi:hypothetical protein